MPRRRKQRGRPRRAKSALLLPVLCRSGAEPLLLPNRNYVLLRRFNAKEEPRRLTAAPWLASEFAVPEIGTENHRNYIHRRGGTLPDDEAWGLAALYNSRLLDTWFRAVNGNTQVSATEPRAAVSCARNNRRAWPVRETACRSDGGAGRTRVGLGRPCRAKGG